LSLPGHPVFTQAAVLNARRQGQPYRASTPPWEPSAQRTLGMPKATPLSACRIPAFVQAELSTAVAGGNEHTGRVLPVLLMHNAKSRREEEALQRSVGVRGFSDFATLLSTAPHDVVELLRINSVVKATSNALGVTQ